MLRGLCFECVFLHCLSVLTNQPCGVVWLWYAVPPFQKPSMTDWWFAKLATGKHALFWQAHSRSAYFSDSTKDFINKILNPDPTKRLTIADIRKHPWFTGATITDGALTAELTRRKADVDEAKNRQKLEKKQQEAQSAGSNDGSLENDKVRALGDTLPSTTPAMGFSAIAVRQTALFASASPFGSSNSGFDFGSGGSFDAGSASPAPADSKSESAAPAVFNADEHVTCYTRFDSAAKPSYLLSRVCAVLEAMNARMTSQLSNWSVKATVMTGSGNVTITAQVYADPSDPSNYIVLFRRRSGDSMQYRSLYQDVRTQLLDLVVIKKKAAAPAPAPTASADQKDAPATTNPAVASAAAAIIATAKATIANTARPTTPPTNNASTAAPKPVPAN